MKVNLLNPGAMRTAMRAKAMPGENPEEVPNPLLITPLIVDMLSASFSKNDALVNFRETTHYKH